MNEDLTGSDEIFPTLRVICFDGLLITLVFFSVLFIMTIVNFIDKM